MCPRSGSREEVRGAASATLLLVSGIEWREYQGKSPSPFPKLGQAQLWEDAGSSYNCFSLLGPAQERRGAAVAAPSCFPKLGVLPLPSPPRSQYGNSGVRSSWGAAGSCLLPCPPVPQQGAGGEEETGGTFCMQIEVTLVVGRHRNLCPGSIPSEWVKPGEVYRHSVS